MIDSHQHFWSPERGDYGWMGPHVAPLLRDFLPKDLKPLMARTGVARTVLVQAAQTEAETRFLLGLAEENDFVAGVVGWLDMDDEAFPERLERLRHPKLVGLRPMLQDLEEDDWILRPRVLKHLGLVAREGLAFDILAFSRHLPFVERALVRTPALRAVIDHLAKPEIEAGVLDPWRERIAALAAFPNVSAKVSGLVTEAGPNWRLEDLRPYVDHAVAVFGPERLMFGSDWPVATLRASYAEVVAAGRTLLGNHFAPAGMARVFETNAAEFYRLGKC